MPKLAVIDLFAGAGGLGLGAEMAGAAVRLSVDVDAIAVSTLLLNRRRRHKICFEDIRTLTGIMLRSRAGLRETDPLIVIGGAPCQPFSKAAYWTDKGDEARYRRARAHGLSIPRPIAPIKARSDSRRSLVGEFWRLVSETRADGFVFENVPAITHPRNRPILNYLVSSATSAGYRVRVIRLNAINFGVPQRRERVFVLGARNGMPNEPVATHALTVSADSELLPALTVGEVLAPFAGRAFAEREEIITGRWADHLREVPPGWNYKAHTAWGGHPHPTFETETRFWNFLLKLHPDKPSWTIAANPGPWTGPFHWKSRRLRTVELAALQGFPIGYQFDGSRRERVRQIGNAVPPPLAAAAIRQVVAAVSRSQRPRRQRDGRAA